MYKLVAIDCDNTLLNSNGFINEENKNVISLLKEKGINFILVTGRNDVLVFDYVKELNISAPVIGCNGATIRNPYTMDTLKISYIPRKSALDVYKYCNENNIILRAYNLDSGYCDDEEVTKKGLSLVLGENTKKLTSIVDYKYTDDMQRLLQETDFLKLLIVSEEQEKLMKYQNDLRSIEGLNLVRSAKICLDIVSSEASKGSAVKFYSEKLNIKPEEVIAIGDNENDISMLKFAGCSVAMGNAEENVKEHADFVTETNNNGGVGKALKRIFSDII